MSSQKTSSTTSGQARKVTVIVFSKLIHATTTSVSVAKEKVDPKTAKIATVGLALLL